MALTLAVIALASAGLALCDLGLGGLTTPTSRRQTAPRWWRQRGAVVAMLLWGLDLGLGFTTVRVASAFWAVSLLALVLRSPGVGAAILAAYGLGLTANLLIGTTAFGRDRRGLHANIDALRLYPFIRVALGSVLLAWSGLLFAVALLQMV